MATSLFKPLRQPGGLTDAKGFVCGATASGIRGEHSQVLDLGFVYSALPCTAAGVFTTNAVSAAPVKISRQRLEKPGPFHGVVFNSGNANACTGEQGWRDAELMLATCETAFEAPAGSFLVASTGRIGRDLPMQRVVAGLPRAFAAKAGTSAAGLAAADCILTSDTRRKVVSVRVKTAEGSYTLAGIAKGAGMIQPNMATMLAFLTTDAAVPARTLQRLLRECVGPSFNAITVDGDASTNDTVIALANGASGISIRGELREAFAAGFSYVCEQLARLIVGDGEKISKVVEICVSGARSAKEADLVARAIGNSLLVKSSWYGNDPNWGRILDAAGYSGAAVEEEKIELAYRPTGKKRGVTAFSKGRGVESNLARWKEVVAERAFSIDLDLGLGRGSARLLASDLTEAYVHFNKSE